MSFSHPLWPPETLRQYGHDAAGELIRQATPSGFLLPWDAIDAESTALSRHEPCQYLVIGETVRDDGVRFPELGINPVWMEHRGYVRSGRFDWHRPAA
jgi:hypothetical protein